MDRSDLLDQSILGMLTTLSHHDHFPEYAQIYCVDLKCPYYGSGLCFCANSEEIEYHCPIYRRAEQLIKRNNNMKSLIEEANIGIQGNAM